jgi:hypothetical protein
MPHSDPALRPWVADTLIGLGVAPATVVDVGAGAGDWLTYLGQVFPAAAWTAVEIWEPYVQRFGLAARYDKVVIDDVRDWPMEHADLYLFGDVLEHLAADDAVQVWDRARAHARWLVINLPVLPYPQGPTDGNPHEAHLHQWDMESVLANFAGITDCHGPVPGGSTVGAFIARGTERT